MAKKNAAVQEREAAIAMEKRQNKIASATKTQSTPVHPPRRTVCGRIVEGQQVSTFFTPFVKCSRSMAKRGRKRRTSQKGGSTFQKRKRTVPFPMTISHKPTRTGWYG